MHDEQARGAHQLDRSLLKASAPRKVSYSVVTLDTSLAGGVGGGWGLDQAQPGWKRGNDDVGKG